MSAAPGEQGPGLLLVRRFVKAPPQGDCSLIVRAEQIRKGYGRARANDTIFLALVEQLTALGAPKADFVTVDEGMMNQATANARTALVKVLRCETSPPVSG